MKYSNEQITAAMKKIAEFYKVSAQEHDDELNKSIDIALDSMEQVILIKTVLEDDSK